MIFHSPQLSPNQRAVIEELVGHKLQDGETITLCAESSATPCEPGRQAAAEQMRRYLGFLDRTDRRMSVEDCAAALLESTGTGARA